MLPSPDERRRALFQKLRQLIVNPITWKVIVMAGQVLAWLWEQLHPPR